jgi:sigma-B regulation protein RsbU (phosphoserine phosphatase)
MRRILVVEDEPGIALALEDTLRLEGFDVAVQRSGLDVTRTATVEAFDLLLLDVMLPGKNGFQICHELRQASVKTPIILLSARSLEADRVRGLELGANDYVVKPYLPRELMARIRRLLRQEDDTRRARSQLDAEMQAASEVQRRLFPQVKPVVPGLDYAAVCRPARVVSGDYFDFIPLGDGRLGFLVADVSGKGMSAALLGASLQAAVRAYAVRPGCTCGEVLALCNRILFDATAAERYVTVFFGILDPATRVLSYANAGHYPPWVVGASSLSRLDSLTAPVGMFPEMAPNDKSLQLRAGDWLLVVSDGIPEACDRNGDEFGDERLLTLLKAGSVTAAEFCRRAIDAVNLFSQNEPADDLTLLAVRIVPYS